MPTLINKTDALRSAAHAQYDRWGGASYLLNGVISERCWLAHSRDMTETWLTNCGMSTVDNEYRVGVIHYVKQNRTLASTNDDFLFQLIMNFSCSVRVHVRLRWWGYRFAVWNYYDIAVRVVKIPTCAATYDLWMLWRHPTYVTFYLYFETI